MDTWIYILVFSGLFTVTVSMASTTDRPRCTRTTFTARRELSTPVHRPPAQQAATTSSPEASDHIMVRGLTDRGGQRARDNHYVISPSPRNAGNQRSVRDANYYSDKKTLQRNRAKSKEPVKGRGTTTYVRPDGWHSSAVRTQPENNNVRRHDRDSGDVIICADCGRCRCTKCKTPKQLPSRWLCGDACLLSGETIVDYCSCMCCVKGGLYLCYGESESDSGEDIIDNPCTCDSDHRCVRWTCLSILSTLLPCILCYLPLKGCLRFSERCYASCRSNACRCPRLQPHPEQPPRVQLPERRRSTPNKHLLHSDC